MSVRLLSTGLLALVLLSTPAVAQPSGNSSANWVTAGPVHAVARSGNTVFLGGEFNAIAPRSQQIGGFGVFNALSTRRTCALPPINGSVTAIVPDPAGGFFVGGRFESVGAVEWQNLVHITSTCAVDTGWSGIVRGRVNALSVAGDVLYVGGSFSEAGQQGGGLAARANLAAFGLGTGVLQTWNPGSNGEVHALKAHRHFAGMPSQAITNVFVGGAFTTLAGTSRQNLGAVDATGAITSFVADADAPVFALEVEPKFTTGPPTRVYAGGDFTSIAGGARSRIAAVVIATNTLEPAFDPAANGRVRAILMFGDTLPSATFYVGGEFSQIGGASKNYVAAVSPAGLALPFAVDPDGPVFAIAPDFTLGSPGSIYIGGRFSRVNENVVRLNAARVHPASGAAQDWHPAFNGDVRAIAAGSLLRIALGGDFDAIGARRRSNLAAIDLDSGQLLAFNPEINGPVHALTVRNDELYVGGDFSRIDAVTVHNIAAFASGARALKNWYPDVNGAVRALTSSGSTIFAGGDFTAVGTDVRGRLAGIDAATGAATSWTPPDFDTTVQTLLFDGAFLYVGGAFTTVGGASVPYVTRLSSDTGARDVSWSPAPNGEVRAICTTASAVYIGGVFTVAGGAPRANLAAVDDTTGSATAWQPEPDGAVNALSCRPLGVFAGGAFTTIGSGAAQQTRPRLAGLSSTATGPTGAYATSFSPRALGIVEDLLASSDGLLAVGAGDARSDEEEPSSRFAFFPLDFVGTPGPPTLPSVLVASPVLGPVLNVPVRLRWNPPVRGPQPTSYRIFAGSSQGGSNYANGFEVTGTQLDVNAPIGVPVYVRIHAANASGLSGPSEELFFITSFACSGPPDPPSTLNVSVAGARVTFDWTPSSGEFVAAYRLEAGITPGGTNVVLALSTATTSFSVDAPEGVFYARLRAVGSCGTSLASSEVTLATGSATPPPTPPLNLNAAVGSLNSVTVSWSAPASGTATSYRLEAGSGFRLADLASVTTSSTSITVARVPPGTYYLRVYAIGVGGASAASEELIFKFQVP